MREVKGEEKTETEVTEVYGILESGQLWMKLKIWMQL